MEKYEASKDLPAIVYSTPLDTSCAMNAIDFLKLSGFRNIQWFELGNREWQKGSSAAKSELDISMVSQASTPDVLKASKDKTNYVLVDMRAPEQYDFAHIPLAKSNHLMSVDAAGFQSAAKKIPYLVDLVSLDKGLATIFAKPFVTVVGKTKNVIFYTDSFRPKDFTTAAKDLRRQVDLEQYKYSFYAGGLAEWTAHGEWQPDQGYDIEKKQP
jgi:rhodanese-related sulfurtransferase